MTDVIIIGGGSTGQALATTLLAVGHDVLVVEQSAVRPADWQGEWIAGRAVVNSPQLVAILDPQTGDERRLIECAIIVVATGPSTAAASPSRMLGVSKLGAQFTVDGTQILSDKRGRTRASGIYATGRAASGPTPDIIDDITNVITTVKTGQV